MFDNLPPTPVTNIPAGFPCASAPEIKMATLQDGLDLCKELNRVLRPIGFFPALTGGLVYKEGKRKDIDIVIYRHRQLNPIMPELDSHNKIVKALNSVGVTIYCCYGFCTKARWNGFVVDLFNPESSNGDDYVSE